MRRRRNNNRASTSTVPSVDSGTVEKNLWLAYGDPDILDSDNNNSLSPATQGRCSALGQT